MEHLPSPEDRRVTIEDARTMLRGAPDGLEACRGFDRAIAEQFAGAPSAEDIVVVAARQLRATLKQHRKPIVDELRSRLMECGWLDRHDRQSVTRATLRAMDRELHRATKQERSDDDLFLRTESVGTWPTWTQQLLTRNMPPPPLPAVEPGNVHPALGDEHYEALRQGNVELFMKLAELSRPTLFSIASDNDVAPADRDDVVAEAIAKAQRSIAKIDGETPWSFYAWLNTITERTISDHLKRESKQRGPIDKLAEQVADRQRLKVDETPRENWELVPDPVDPTILRAVIDAVINTHLLPAAAGIDGAAVGSTGTELADYLVSPGLATQRKSLAQAHRTVLAAAVDVLRRLGTPTPPSAASEHSGRKASTPTRTSIQRSRTQASDHTPDADAPAKNTGGESHASRRMAPDVLFAAQRALRAWLDDTAEAADAKADAMAIWCYVWLIERELLVAQLEAISVQFAGAVSTLSVLSADRLLALEGWSSGLLAELLPDQAIDDTRSETGNPAVEASRQMSVIDGLVRSITLFEKPKKPKSSGIDAHQRGLEELERAASPDERKRQRLHLAISHYTKLRETYDAYVSSKRTIGQQLEADSRELLDPDTTSVTRVRHLQQRCRSVLTDAPARLADPADRGRITEVARRLHKQMGPQPPGADGPPTAELLGVLRSQLRAAIGADAQDESVRDLVALRLQHFQDLSDYLSSNIPPDPEPTT